MMRLPSVLAKTLGLIGAACVAGCGSAPAAEPPADANADAARNVRLVGHHDLEGRESLVVTVKADAANGSWWIERFYRAAGNRRIACVPRCRRLVLS